MSEGLLEKLEMFGDDFVQVPTDKQIEYEKMLLHLSDALRGSTSNEAKNVAVKLLRKTAKNIENDIDEREKNR